MQHFLVLTIYNNESYNLDNTFLMYAFAIFDILREKPILKQLLLCLSLQVGYIPPAKTVSEVPDQVLDEELEELLSLKKAKPLICQRCYALKYNGMACVLAQANR